MSSTRTRKTTRRRKRPSSKAPEALVPAERKKEILGLVLLVLGFLLFLAIVTHSRADDALVEDAARWGDVFDVRDNRVDNLLGPVGAIVSRWLVVGFLGYPVLLLVGTLFGWGYVLFRRKSPLFLPLLTALAAGGACLVACFFGWLDPRTDTALDHWAGAIGLGVAGWLTGMVGSVGAFVLIALALFVTALLVFDRDIQTSLDRLEELFAAFRDRIQEMWTAFRSGAEARKKLRGEHLQERRARQATRNESAAVQKKTRAKPRTPAVSSPQEAPLPPRHVEARPSANVPAALPLSPPSVSAGDGDEGLLDTLVEAHQREPKSPDSGGPQSAGPEPALHIHGPVEEETVDLDSERPVQPDAHAFAYSFPSIERLEEPDNRKAIDLDEIEENKQILLDKLDTYRIQIAEIDAVVGPTVTRYELTPAPGVKISRITALEDDLAMALAAPGIRIIAPIPGKSAIGVEIPNRTRELVRLRSMLTTKKFRDASAERGGMALPVVIGKTIEGEVFIEDLTRMPHLLVAGATGSGKSVGINTLITGLLYANHPADLKFVLVDPKKIELNTYAGLLDHFIAMPADAEDPITTDFGLATGVLKSCEREMEVRYDLLAEAGVRGIQEYNAKLASGALNSLLQSDDDESEHRHLPYIVVVIDELADLMMTSGKEVEAPIARLAQMARAVGIHLVIATQRPSVDVITGLIKANFPSRVAYQVASRIDSRTILDGGGAQHLIGNGDLLYMNGSRITRVQGPFVSLAEVESVVHFIQAQSGAGPYLLPAIETSGGDGTIGSLSADRDDLFDEAARVIVRSQQGSVSLLQRKLSVGYTRAARIVDQLEEAGIVGPFEGSKARDVLVADELQLDHLLQASS